MGKSRKLGCLFGLKRNRSSSTQMSHKLPLSKLSEKCPVTPNQYVHDGKERIADSMSKLKSGTADPDDQPEEILPMKIKDERLPTSQELSDSNTESMMPKKGTRELPLNLAEQKSPSVNKSERTFSAWKVWPELSAPTSANTNSNSLSPTQSSSSCLSAGNVSLSAEQKMCKVPSQKFRGFYQRENACFNRAMASNARYRDFPSTSTLSTASSTSEESEPSIHHNRCQLPPPDNIANPSSSRDHFQKQRRHPVKDCDFGWVSDEFINAENNHELPSSTHRNCRNQQNMEQRYVNSCQEMCAPSHFLGREVAFTIKESNGNCLQFTVAESGLDIRFPHDHVQNAFDGGFTNPLMSSLHHLHFETPQRGEQQPHRPSNSCEVRYDTNQHSSDCTMTPNLPHRSDTESMEKLHQPARKNEDFKVRGKVGATMAKNCDGAIAATRRKPHFELSMASYSKLIAYCDTNRLIRESQSASMQRPQSKSLCNMPLPYPSIPPTPVNDLCRLAKVLETVEECPWYWGALTGQDAKKVLRNSEPGTFLLRDSSDPRHLFSLSVKTSQGPTSIRIVYTDGSFRFDSEMDDVNSRRIQGRNRLNNASSSRSDHPNYVKKITPIFTCVVKMVLHYTNHLGLVNPKTRTRPTPKQEHCPKCSANLTEISSERENTSSARLGDSYQPEQFMCYWVNRSGRQEIPVLLSTPLSRKQSFPSLQKLCRQSLNVSLNLWARDDIIDQFPLPNKLKKYLKKYPYPV